VHAPAEGTAAGMPHRSAWQGGRRCWPSTALAPACRGPRSCACSSNVVEAPKGGGPRMRTPVGTVVTCDGGHTPPPPDQGPLRAPGPPARFATASPYSFSNLHPDERAATARPSRRNSMRLLAALALLVLLAQPTEVRDSRASPKCPSAGPAGRRRDAALPAAGSSRLAAHTLQGAGSEHQLLSITAQTVQLLLYLGCRRALRF